MKHKNIGTPPSTLRKVESELILSSSLFLSPPPSFPVIVWVLGYPDPEFTVCPSGLVSNKIFQNPLMVVAEVGLAVMRRIMGASPAAMASVWGPRGVPQAILASHY